MERAETFEELTSNLASCGSIRKGEERLLLTSETKAVTSLSSELADRLTAAKELRKVKLKVSDSIEWSLICSSGYNVRTMEEEKLRALSGRVVHETSDDILGCRERLLRLPLPQGLRLRLWLEVNQWMFWNPSGLLTCEPKVVFDYWDKMPDSIDYVPVLYNKTKQEKIDALYQKDVKRMGELGDFLTGCPALCNNPNAPRAERVISSDIKAAIDSLLEVSNSLSEWAHP